MHADCVSHLATVPLLDYLCPEARVGHDLALTGHGPTLQSLETLVFGLGFRV